MVIKEVSKLNRFVRISPRVTVVIQVVRPNIQILKRTATLNTIV